MEVTCERIRRYKDPNENLAHVLLDIHRDGDNDITEKSDICVKLTHNLGHKQTKNMQILNF